MCKRTYNGSILVHSYFTYQQENQPWIQFVDPNRPALGISEVKGIFHAGTYETDREIILKCSFKRQKQIKSMSERFFDITNQTYYLLIARGNSYGIEGI